MEQNFLHAVFHRHRPPNNCDITVYRCTPFFIHATPTRRRREVLHFTPHIRGIINSIFFTLFLLLRFPSLLFLLFFFSFNYILHAAEGCSSTGVLRNRFAFTKMHCSAAQAQYSLSSADITVSQSKKTRPIIKHEENYTQESRLAITITCKTHCNA